MYKIKMISEDTIPKKKKEKSESMLKDLLAVIPTLKRHALEGEVISQVRKLRSGRRIKKHTLELTRKYKGKDIKVSAALTKSEDKIKVLRNLKQDIYNQIKALRKAELPPIEDFSFREGVTVKKLAEVYLEPGSFVKVMHKKIRLDMVRRDGRKPTTADNYLGIELELASKFTRDQLCDALFEAGVGKYVNVKDDGSIGTGTNLKETHPYTHEICILVKQSEYVDVITKLCSVLDACQVKVDKTCGMHVHIDMRHRDVKVAFNNLVLSQQFLYAMLPAARRSSRYSYPVKGAEFRKLESRYHGINSEAYAKYNTLEARMHCGTTQAKKIINWIALLVSITDAPKMTTAPVTIEELATLTTLSPNVIDYVKSRIAKFESQHKNATYTSEQPNTMPNIVMPTHAPADDTEVEQSEVA